MVKTQGEDGLFDKVEQTIAKVRPALGANIVELVDVSDGIVRVQVILSSCSAGMPEQMIVSLIEEQVKDELPEIREVVAVGS
ncbi:MAG: NifU family protein [Dehalococcoidia bacterium]|nr:NifU family protein [Dehalococcoidia bacterium]